MSIHDVVAISQNFMMADANFLFPWAVRKAESRDPNFEPRIVNGTTNKCKKISSIFNVENPTKDTGVTKS